MTEKSIMLIAPSMALGALLAYGAIESVRGWCAASSKSVISVAEDPIDSDKWTARTQQRVRSTYAALGGSIVLTGASAFVFFKVGVAKSLAVAAQRHPFLTHGALVLTTCSFFLGSRVRGPVERQRLLYAGFAASLGLTVSPIGFVGAPILQQALLLTAAATLPLCAAGAMSPSRSYLFLAAPLSVGLGALTGLQLISRFFPGTSPEATGLAALQLWGGLGLFATYTLVHSAGLVHRAREAAVFDPVEESTDLFLDLLNMFVRVVQVLVSGRDTLGNRRRRDEQ